MFSSLVHGEGEHLFFLWYYHRKCTAFLIIISFLLKKIVCNTLYLYRYVNFVNDKSDKINTLTRYFIAFSFAIKKKKVTLQS